MKLKNDLTPQLFSYIIPNDFGAAPNPFWGLMTLVIFKPVIRRTAKIGDWIVGIGNRNKTIFSGKYGGKLVYAMQVSEIMSMKDYDVYCAANLPNKIPDRSSTDKQLWMGDSIYDFSKQKPKVRSSVHTIQDREHDLGGINALLSNKYFYFGQNAIELPEYLQEIADVKRYHKCNFSKNVAVGFIDWISTFKVGVHGNPQGLENYKPPTKRKLSLQNI